MAEARDHVPAAWPRGMRAGVAAAYVGLSLSTFLREVEEGRAPAPGAITAGRKIWLRDHLDAYLDSVFQASQPVSPTSRARQDLAAWSP